MPKLDILNKNLAFLEAQMGNPPSVEELFELSERIGYPVDVLLRVDLAQRGSLKDIRMLVMDCDGVLTDGKMIFTREGDEIKHFNAQDGMGLKRWHAAGGFSGIISAGRSSGLVERRAEMMHVNQVYVGKQPKMEVLEKWLGELELGLSEVAYVGDDVSDLPVMERVGASFCPQNAVKAVRDKSQIVLGRRGGEGCVRELIEDYLLPVQAGAS